MISWIAEKLFAGPARYWVQARYYGSSEFCVISKFEYAGAAREAGEAAMAEGVYDEVIVQNVDNGKRLAEFH